MYVIIHGKMLEVGQIINILNCLTCFILAGIHFIDQQRYRCPTCGQSFAWKSTLNKHMLTHSIGPLPRYRCDLCSKEYAAATQVQVNVTQ
jgi:transposase-like protein